MILSFTTGEYRIKVLKVRPGGGMSNWEDRILR